MSDQAWENIGDGFRRASEGFQRSQEGLLAAGLGLQQAIEGFIQAVAATRQANAERGDLRDTVARLEALVLEQQQDIRALRQEIRERGNRQ